MLLQTPLLFILRLVCAGQRWNYAREKPQSNAREDRGSCCAFGKQIIYHCLACMRTHEPVHSNDRTICSLTRTFDTPVMFVCCIPSLSAAHCCNGCLAVLLFTPIATHSDGGCGEENPEAPAVDGGCDPNGGLSLPIISGGFPISSTATSAFSVGQYPSTRLPCSKS